MNKYVNDLQIEVLSRNMKIFKGLISKKLKDRNGNTKQHDIVKENYSEIKKDLDKIIKQLDKCKKELENL